MIFNLQASLKIIQQSGIAKTVDELHVNPLKPNSSYCYICHKGLTYHFQFLTFGHSAVALRVERQST